MHTVVCHQQVIVCLYMWSLLLMFDHVRTVCINAYVCVCVTVLQWHKSQELNRLLLVPPSVSVCMGEVFYTDDRVNGRR